MTQVLKGITLCRQFPRTKLLPLMLSVNHFQAAQLSLVAAAAFGNLCPLRTVVIGSDIHMVRLLQAALRVERTAGPERQAAQNP